MGQQCAAVLAVLVPFLIRWIGEEGIHPLPVAAYGVVLIMAAVAYLLLERALIAAEGEESKVEAAVGSKHKEWMSLISYMSGRRPGIRLALIFGRHLYRDRAMWLIPDRRFEFWR